MQFSRTLAPDISKGPALIAFMQHHNWGRVTILSTTESIWLETRTGLAKQFMTASIKVLRPAAFEPGHFKTATLSEIKRSGFRIVILMAYEQDVHTVALNADREAMAGAGWGWLLVELVLPIQAMAGWLWFRPFLQADSTEAFAQQVSDYSKAHFNLTVSPDSVDLTYSAALYNAITLYAHAATRVMSEGGDLQDGEAVTAAVRNTSFIGLGGSLVVLDSKGDLITSYEVMNTVLEEGDVFSSVAVGKYNSTLRQYKAYERAVVWPGETSEVPADYFSGMFQLIGRLLWMACCEMFCMTFVLAVSPIHFAFLMPLTGSWDGGKRTAGAAALAVERVNNNKALLPGRWLEYSSADSGCSAKQGLVAMGELLRGATRVDAVIGPGCSSACEVTSHLSEGQLIPQISWGCTSGSLSDKEKYRLVRLLSLVSCVLCLVVV